MKRAEIIDLSARIVVEFEGLETAPYFCPAGRLSVGVGHVIRDNEPELRGGISREKAIELLHADLLWALAEVEAARSDLTVRQAAALVSLVFNIGGPAWRRSTIRRLIVAGDFAAAAAEFARWCKVAGKVVNGLANRRAGEAKIFREEV